MIHSRVSWMCLPVERSITVSAPQSVAQRSLSTSSSIDELTAELPMFALIFTRKLRPMIIGSSFGMVDVGRDDGAAARDFARARTRRSRPSRRATNSISGVTSPRRA